MLLTLNLVGVNGMDDFLIKVGKRIREIRKSKGLTQEEVGEQAGKHGEGLSYSYIGRIEAGQKNVSLVTLKRIADALGVSVSQFFIDFEDNEFATPKDKQLSQILDLLSVQNEGKLHKLHSILNVLVLHID